MHSLCQRHNSMTPAQLRMARAATGWTVRDLGARTGVHRNTITRLEGGAKGEARTLADIRRVFEAAGVEFLDDGAAPGVRYDAARSVSPD
jgi:transcriptional regulator with XRE-family HTH domain